MSKAFATLFGAVEEGIAMFIETTTQKTTPHSLSPGERKSFHARQITNLHGQQIIWNQGVQANQNINTK